MSHIRSRSENRIIVDNQSFNIYTIHVADLMGSSLGDKPR